MKKRIVFTLAAIVLLSCGAYEAGTLTTTDDRKPLLAKNAPPAGETEDVIEGRGDAVITQYAVGDIIFADGSVTQAENLTSIEKDNQPVAVIAEIKEDGTALGLGVHRSSEPLPWAPVSSLGNRLKFTELVCTQEEGEDAATAIFTGKMDGCDSWDIVCSADDQGTKEEAENYPAFHFVNVYAETCGVTGTFASGWYVPSISEVCAIYRNRECINASLQKIHRLNEQAAMDGLGTNWYWSSTQSDSGDDYAWFVHYFNGYVCDCPKDFTNLHVLAVRIFE